MGLFSHGRARSLWVQSKHTTVVLLTRSPHTHMNPMENCLISFSLSCCCSFLNAFDLALAIASSSSWTVDGNSAQLTLKHREFKPFSSPPAPSLSSLHFVFFWFVVVPCRHDCYGWLLPDFCITLSMYKHTHTRSLTYLYFDILFSYADYNGSIFAFSHNI